MHIVHVAAEMAPIAKAGGLGDAVTGLTKELQKHHQVSVILPKYSLISLSPTQLTLDMEFSCEKKRLSYNVRVFRAEVEGVFVYLVETSPLIDHFYEKKIYLGTQRDSERFIYFCKTVAEYLIRKNQVIDVLHLHDWHTSLLVPLVKEVYLSLKVLVRSVVLTVHNLAYIGRCFLRELEEIHYPLNHIESFACRGIFFKKYSLLRAGLFADAIVAVSPGYREEMLTKRYACGFLRLLEKRRDKVHGILNGIDKDLWDPQKDPHVPFPFSPKQSLAEVFRAKNKDKEALQKKLGLPLSHEPLVICVARLVPQKSPKLMKEGLLLAKEASCQGILLGTSPLKKEQAVFEKLADTYKGDSHLRFLPTFDEPLSRLLYAAADFFLMPSSFEPCGLSQMIAMRYGTVPIVHHVGGLKDTVFDPRYENASHKVNGFSLHKLSTTELKKTLSFAIASWRKDRCALLVSNGIQHDYSWKVPAEKYVQIYQKVLSSKK